MTEYSIIMMIIDFNNELHIHRERFRRKNVHYKIKSAIGEVYGPVHLLP